MSNFGFALCFSMKHAREAADVGLRLHTGALNPIDSAADQAFLEHFHALQALKLPPRLVVRIQAALWRLQQKSHTSASATQLKEAVDG